MKEKDFRAMNKKKIIWFLFVLFSFSISCKNEKSNIHQRIDFVKISLSFEGCDQCDYQEDIEIDFEGNFFLNTNRFGEFDSYTKDQYYGKVNSSLLDSISQIVNRIDFEKINSKNPIIIDAKIYKILAYYKKDGKIRNKFFWGSKFEIEDLDFMINYLEELINKTKFERITNDHFFECSFKIRSLSPAQRRINK